MCRLHGTFTAWRAVAGVIGTAALAFVAAVVVASEVVPMKAGEAAGGTLLLKSGANGETFAVPLLATDPYGNFIPNPTTGFPQVVMAGPPQSLASGTPAAPRSDRPAQCR